MARVAQILRTARRGKQVARDDAGVRTIAVQDDALARRASQGQEAGRGQGRGGERKRSHIAARVRGEAAIGAEAAARIVLHLGIRSSRRPPAPAARDPRGVAAVRSQHLPRLAGLRREKRVQCRALSRVSRSAIDEGDRATERGSSREREVGAVEIDISAPRRRVELSLTGTRSREGAAARKGLHLGARGRDEKSESEG